MEQSSDKENVAIKLEIGEKGNECEAISSDDSDSAENARWCASKKSKKRSNVLEDSDEEEHDSPYNTNFSFDDYESPDPDPQDFGAEENNNDVELVLGVEDKKNERIAVHPKIVSHLKSHQIEGLKFLFECCYKDSDREADHGCILAHCMGLGKTLTIIALLHTVIRFPQFETQKVLVICPKSTILNWKAEIDKWLDPITGRKLKVFTFPESSTIGEKIKILKTWFETDVDFGVDAGCFLLGYEAFMKVIKFSASKMCTPFQAECIQKYLLEPGADLVVLDEGHRIKNPETATNQAVKRIKTKRRIILTGTPMQNHLKEYYNMINFIKPGFLGDAKEFADEYATPIRAGQHKDSTPKQVEQMVEKCFLLHEKVSNYVQRRDVSVLKESLPQKYEYDLFIPMTEIQNHLYEHYLMKNPYRNGTTLLPDYHTFRKIWSHPKVLEFAYNAAWNDFQNKVKAQDLHSNNGDSSDDEDFRLARNGELIIANNFDQTKLPMYSPLNGWWKEQVTQEQRDSILSSNKFKILFDIVNTCELQNEKCLIFSEYTKVLDAVEFAMKQITKEVDSSECFEGFEEYHCEVRKWVRAHDYCRLDGSTSQTDRFDLINRFNHPDEKRLRVFLISSKAGGQGINLVAATRVILLDTAWNPSNDQQSIFRVFRMGQDKSCYIYRLLAMGTMEEKVYSRSVTKQATSCRVIDKQQVKRQYREAELKQLYTLSTPNMSARPVPKISDDNLLNELLAKYPDIVYKYQEHESLLEEVVETVLTEEKKEALRMQNEMRDIERANTQTASSPWYHHASLPTNLPGCSSQEIFSRPLFNVNRPILSSIENIPRGAAGSSQKRKTNKQKPKAKHSTKKSKPSFF